MGLLLREFGGIISLQRFDFIIAFEYKSALAGAEMRRFTTP